MTRIVKGTIKALILINIMLLGSVVKGEGIYTDGRLDTSFARGQSVGPNMTAQTIYVLSTGKILIGGSNWSSYMGEDRGYLVRLNSDGSFDNTFNEGGAGASRTGAWASIYSIIEQIDGKIIIGGRFTTYNGLSRNRIARLNSDGSLDTSFDPGTGATSTISALDIQSDGKILIGGDFTTYNGVSRNRIARLNSDGSLDTSFDPGTGATSTISTLDIQLDNKIVIAGYFTTYNGVSRNRIARLNSDGSLDTSFDPGTGAASTIYTSDIQLDNKIVIAGSFTTYNGVSRNRIARLNSDGSLDTSFDPGTGAASTIYTSGIQLDNKIVIAGSFTTYNGVSRNRIARLNSDGSLDTSFDPGTGATSTISTLDIQLDNKIVIAGYFTTYNGEVVDRIARLDTSGTLDSNFLMHVALSGPNTKIRSIGIQEDGKILISGGCDFKYYNGVYVGGIARINQDGSLDMSFNNGGVGLDYEANSFVQEENGKIIIGGWFRSYNGVSRKNIARLNSDGSLDTSFDPGSGTDSGPYTLKLQPDGKIVIGGYFSTYNGVSMNRIARLNSDGSLDTSFDPGTGANGAIYSVAIQTDGKILIGGTFTTYNGISRNRIARLNSDGSLDTSFDPGVGANNKIRKIDLQSSYKVIILGTFTSFNGVSINSLARLNSDGSLDVSFNNYGSGISVPVSGEVLIVQDDDKILFTFDGKACEPEYNGVKLKKFNRLNSDGTLDTEFNSSGTGPNSKVKAAVVGSDGSIFIAGRFQSYNDTKVAYLAKLGLPDVESPTGSISINSGASYTTNSNVTLTLNAVDTYSGLKEMMVCSNSSFEGCSWESYTASKSWVVDSSIGTKTVYVKYKDNEDNSSEVYSDSIELYNLVVRITDIGLIDDVPDRESLFYYFTSQRVVIKGETKSNSTVYFTYDNETYTTTSDLQGEYSITLWVDKGTVSISYYVEDESGNESPTRTLTLIVGTEYFPDWLLIKLGLLPEIEEEEEVIEEEIVEEEEEEEIVIPEIEEETKTAIQIIGFDGDPLRDTEVVFDGISYITDGEGYIYVIDIEAGSHIVKLKINEEEYSQLLVLGEDDLVGGGIVKFEYEADYTMYFIVGCLSLIIMTSVFMIIYKRRGINKG